MIRMMPEHCEMKCYESASAHYISTVYSLHIFHFHIKCMLYDALQLQRKKKIVFILYATNERRKAIQSLYVIELSFWFCIL